MKHPLAFIDVETTGSSPEKNRVMEVGILRVENGKEVARLDSLINPKQNVPWFIRRMTGINPKELKYSPRFKELIDEIESLLNGAIFVAHNANFDYNFIKQEFIRNDRNFSSKALCTVKLSRKLYPQFRKHNLGAVAHRFALNSGDRHRAFSDAHVLWQFFQKAQGDSGDKVFHQSIEELISNPDEDAKLRAMVVKKDYKVKPVKSHKFWFNSPPKF